MSFLAIVRDGRNVLYEMHFDVLPRALPFLAMVAMK
jgi:hypothetical protein